jgi:hypothetical protein
LHAFRSHVEAEGRSARSEEDENADRTLRPKAEAQDRKKKKHNADAARHRANEYAWQPAPSTDWLDPPIQLSSERDWIGRSSWPMKNPVSPHPEVRTGTRRR